MSALLNHHPTRPADASPEGELADLLNALSEHGILRFLTDMTAALPHVGLIAARGLNSDASVHATRNLVTLWQALGRVPPDDFARFLNAVSAAVQGIERETEDPEDPSGAPPGITGAYHLLQDDALWAALGPILQGLKTFATSLRGPKAAPAEPSQGPLL